VFDDGYDMVNLIQY